MIPRTPMTPEGHATLVAELKHYKEVLRPQTVLEIEEARAHGDLSENAEYHAAKEKNGQGEARKRLVESRLSAAEVIDVTKIESSDRVIFGTTVELFEVEADEELEYRLVGIDEANVKNGTISHESPIGRALLGKEIGDEVLVQAPRGKRVFEILNVRYE